MQSKLFKQFSSSTSLEFANVSVEEYKDNGKRSTHDFSNDSKNIESMYMTAQLILDDLSSRPLTRQSEKQRTPGGNHPGQMTSSLPLSEDIPLGSDNGFVDSPFDESRITQGECLGPISNKQVHGIKTKEIKITNQSQSNANQTPMHAKDNKLAKFENLPSPQLRWMHPPSNGSICSGEGDQHHALMRLKTSNFDDAAAISPQASAEDLPSRTKRRRI